MPLNRTFSRDSKMEGGLVRSLWEQVKRKPSQSYPHYVKTSDLKHLISSPVPSEDEPCPSLQYYCPSSLIDLTGTPQTSPRPTKARPAIPTRTSSFSFRARRKNRAGSGLYTLRSFSSVHITSFSAKHPVSSAKSGSADILDFPLPPPRTSPLAPPRAASVASGLISPITATRRGGNSLYALKSFSTTHLHFLGAKLSSAASASSTDLSSISPIYPLRRSRSSARARSVPTAEWTPPRRVSCLPDHPPQIAALEIFGSFTFPIISQLDGPLAGIPGVIMEDVAEEEEAASPLMPLAAALALDAVPSTPTLSSPAPSPSSGHKSSPRHSIALSYVSGSSNDDSTLYSFPSSGSSISSCPTPPVEATDVPLSPWRIPSGERRKGSVVFPSRLNASASCVSLGRY